MDLEARRLLSVSPLVLGEEIKLEPCAIPEGYALRAEVFWTHWDELLGRSLEIFECPLCHDYDFVANGETLHRHGCGALLFLERRAPQEGALEFGKDAPRASRKAKRDAAMGRVPPAKRKRRMRP